MNHIAIMKKSWGLIPKIVSGEKKIESRWYKNKCAPWDKITKGDIVYFKNSGEPVTIKAQVLKVLKFESLDPKKVREILEKYGEEDGIEKSKVPQFHKLFKDKKYCLLIFLQHPKQIKPFNVSKQGFGMMSAWMCVGDVKNLKQKL